MDCKDTKQRISLWIDQTLDSEERAQVGQHLARCEECRAEFKAYTKVWNDLKIWPDIEPDPGYVSRFWTRISLQKPWYERVAEFLRPLWPGQKLSPVMATLLIVIMIMGITIYRTTAVVRTENVLSKLSADDMDFIENIDLAENLDVLQNLDILDELDSLEKIPEISV